MSPAIGSSLGIVAYMAIFAVTGIAFLFANLLVGWFLRPHDPHAEKLEIYECGEPTIGSSFVQFDLRFYVVALLFIIFDVEVAFFFPWAAVFGKSTNLMNDNFAVVERSSEGSIALTKSANYLYRELGVTPSDRAADGAAVLGQHCAGWWRRRDSRRANHPRRGTATRVDHHRRYRRFFRGAADRLRVCLAAGRSRLGPRC